MRTTGCLRQSLRGLKGVFCQLVNTGKKNQRGKDEIALRWGGRETVRISLIRRQNRKRTVSAEPTGKTFPCGKESALSPLPGRFHKVRPFVR